MLRVIRLTAYAAGAAAQTLHGGGAAKRHEHDDDDRQLTKGEATHVMIRLLPGEAIQRTGLANLQRGAETVGGRLYLTSQRLIFEPHAFNIQTHPEELRLSDVCGMEKCWTKFLNKVPVMPNSLAVHARQGHVLRFVLWHRESWMAAIRNPLPPEACATATSKP